MNRQPHPLEPVIGHEFTKPDLLVQALRHASTTMDGAARTQSNERMEFLGDRVLGLTVASLLYDRFPNEEEGALARRFAGLVSRDALADVADGITLAPHIHLSDGEDAAGGRGNPALLANAMEAVIGALYLDGGLGAAQGFIHARWVPLIDADLTPPKDPKTTLQEWCQARGQALPTYTETDRSGPAHAPRFTVSVSVSSGESASAEGSSKREAERIAADRLLDKLAGWGDV